MKTSLRVALALLVASFAGSSVAFAQLTDTLKFTTTFPFTVGHTNFAAGNYVARPLDGEPAVICIQGEHGGPTAFAIGVGEAPTNEAQKKSDKSEATFVREGSQMVLKSLWDGAASEGLDLLPTTAPVSARNAN